MTTVASPSERPLRALWHLGRPSMLPYVLMLVGAGYGWAHWDRALESRGLTELAWVLAAWTCLHVGTLWLNAAVDRDEGEVLFGRSVQPPPFTGLAAYGALALTIALASVAGVGEALAAGVCVALSILYSHPATLWKGHPVGGPAVNLIGYGLMSPLVGFLVVDVPTTPRSVVVWLLLGMVVLGMYFAAQAFQADEDRDRGYRTLVATHGPSVVLRAARSCINVSIAGGLVLAAIGWLPRACLLCIPGWWYVDRWLVAWAQQPDGGTAAWARGFTKRLLWVGLFGLCGAFADYAWDSYEGRPVAGLGTRSGHPSDRPLLPPRQMRLWERRAGVVLCPGCGEPQGQPPGNER